APVARRCAPGLPRHRAAAVLPLASARRRHCDRTCEGRHALALLSAALYWIYFPAAPWVMPQRRSGGLMFIAKRLLPGLLLAVVATTARAEMAEINVAQQYGVAFLPLMLMERDKLVEKHARAEGLGDVKVGWIKVAGPSGMNDGIISGSLQFTSGGAPS